jgi:predicted dehydrogenase
VGIGRHGRQILGELEQIDGVTLSAICDSDPARLESGQRRAAGARGVGDYRELLEASGPDAIIIATPTHLHRAIAVAAAQAGKHVYCEAPLAHTIEDCRAIATAARAGAKVFQVGFQGRSNPVYKLAWGFYRSGTVRDLVQMRAQSARKTTWRIPTPDLDRERALNWRLDPSVSLGLAGEWGAQQFDVFHWYTGNFPMRITGAGHIALHGEDGRTVPDTIHATLEFPGGTALLYQATLANSYGGEYELFCGSSASIKLAWSHGWMFKEADSPTQGWEVYANRQQFHNDEGITLSASPPFPFPRSGQPCRARLPAWPLRIPDPTDAPACARRPACASGSGIRARNCQTIPLVRMHHPACRLLQVAPSTNPPARPSASAGIG